MHRKAAVCAGVIVLMLIAGTVGADDQTGLEPLDLPASVTKGGADKSTLIYPTLDAGLNQVLIAEDPIETAESLGFRVRDGRVQVVAVADEDSEAELITWLSKHDATYISSYRNLVQAFVSVDVLHALESHYLVRSLRKPDYIVHPPTPEPSPKTKLTTYTSQGVTAMNADAWHANGATGQGIKIGIVDLGFQGYGALLGNELPSSSKVITKSFGGSDIQSEPHGTACAEIVYDVAPGISQLYLAVISTGVDMGNAFIWLDEQNVDIITMSAGGDLTGGPADGTGPMSQLIDAVVANNRVVTISAGNSAEEHWQGRWSDADGDGWLNFTSNGEINSITDLERTEKLWIPSDTELTANLAWNQWGSPTTDLDFCLFRMDDESDPAQIVCSEDVQDGGEGQFPRETITYTVVDEGYYGVAVKLYSGDPDVDIELEIVDWPVQYVVQSGSISTPGDTASAITVGALDAGSPYSLEWYSSRGPTNGPGGSLSGGFIKPDIAGYANVSTSSYGPRSSYSYSFNGTSSACPHVAGAAALVWAANPSWSHSQVRTFLESNALDKGPSGRDNTYGYGRLYLGSPPASCSYNLSSTSKTFGSSGGSGSFSVSASSGCSWSANTAKAWIHVNGGSSGSGNGTVSYTVDANTSTSQRSGTIRAADITFTITQSGSSGGGGSSSSGDYTYFAVVAHTTGANNSVWKSTLTLCNVSSSNASVKLTYRYGSSGVVVRNKTVAPYGIAEWTDAPFDLFNVGGKSSGVVTIESSQRLHVAARTFNSSPDGTFGQSLPGVTSGVSMTSSQFGILSPVRRSSQFRTNVGVINTGTKSCTVTIFFGNTNGYVIGDELSITLAPGEWKQINEALKKAGISSASTAIGVVQVQTAGATVWAYATVVDNSSGDPTALGMAIFE
jgi:subtilisin family serine protease